MAKYDDCLHQTGGVQFCLVLPLLENTVILELALAKLDDALSLPYEFEGETIFMPAKLGASSSADIGIQAEDLLLAAETALASVRGSSPSWKIHQAQRPRPELFRDMQSELRNAIENNELELFYQPQIDLKSGRCVGFEALTRWPHLGTYIPPDVFIPYAEQSDLIFLITNWSIQNAVRQLQNLDNMDLGGYPFSVSVNISGRCLGEECLYNSISNALSIWNVAPERLIIELTETAFMEDLDAAAKSCNRLKHELGVKISLDDFGMGYSGMEIIHKVCADELKIDKSFIQDLHRNERSEKILTSLLALGESLGISTVAEGVESSESLRALQALSNGQAQGFLFSKALKGRYLKDWLKNDARRLRASMRTQLT